jgi:MFS family permease
MPPAPTEARLRANVPRILWLNASFMFLVVMPIVVPFLRSHGLTLSQVYELQAIFAGATLLLELPSGYFADLIGRRRALVLACVAKGAAFAVLAVADGFADFVVFELVAAVSISLYSGSDIALIYESYEHVSHEPGEPSRALGRKLLYSQTGETVAALLGGALVLVSLQLPVWVNAIVAWIPLPIALSLVEPPGKRMALRHGENLRHVGRNLFRRGPFLLLLLANQVVFGAATLLAVWAFQPYWGDLGVALAWFGLLWALSNGVVAATGGFAHRIEGVLGFRGVVVAVAILTGAGYFGMAQAAPGGAVALGVAAGLLLSVSRGLNGVVLRNAMNVRVPGEMRATANSFVSLGQRLGFALTGPMVGAAMDLNGVAVTFGQLGWAFAFLAVVLGIPLALAAITPALPSVTARTASAEEAAP